MKKNHPYFFISAIFVCLALAQTMHAQSPGGVSAGLVVWLKADKGTSTTTDNQPVSSWLDQSTMGNDATQITPTAQPRYKKTAFNGNPAIEFFGGARFFNVDLSEIDNHSYTVYVVGKRSNTASNNYVMGVQQTSPFPGFHFGYSNNTTLAQGQYGNSITAPVTGYGAATETPDILMAEFNSLSGKAMKEMEDGIVTTSSNGNISSYVQSAQGVIGRGYDTQGITGKIAEVVIFDRTLSPTEKVQIETYLSIKYGITIPVASHQYHTDPSYANDVAGIGKNMPLQDLNQFSSKSENNDAVITADNATDMQDGEYLFWGNNNQNKVFNAGIINNCAVTSLLQRQWEATEQGEIGEINLAFNTTSIPTANPDDLVLLIDRDGDGFDDETPIYGNYAAPNKTFNSVNINSGQTFTLGIGVARYYSVASGNATGIVWSKTPNGTPVAVSNFCENVDIIVQNGHAITNDIPELICGAFTLNSGGTFNGSTNQLTVHRAFAINGTFNAQTGTVKYSGATSQAITGSVITLFNVESDNDQYVQLNATELLVRGVLNVTDGEFRTSGKLTLPSDASGSGMIGQLLTGDIIGNVKVERYHNATAAGWVNLCSPIQNKQISDWNDDLITTGFLGSDYPNYAFNNVQYYDETAAGPQSNGFNGVNNVADMIQNKKGYFVYMNAGVMNLDVTGSIFKGSLSLPISYTTTGDPSGDGWNLVANPYPSTISWDNPGWIRNNINNAIYVWDASIGQYASYVSGIGNNGGSPYIPSTQSFWLVTNAAGASLTASETVKSTVQGTFRSNNTEQGVFALAIDNGIYKDQTTIAFNEESSLDYDPQFDAYKLAGMNDAPYMASVSADARNLSINCIDPQTTEFIVPIKIEVLQTSTYTFTHSGLFNFANGSCIVLRDKQTGITYDLSAQNKFAIELVAGSAEPRFELVVGEPAIASVTDISCPEKMDGKAIVAGSGTGPLNMIWYNENEEAIRTVENVYGSDSLSGLPAGSYTVVIENNGACPLTVASFDIYEPAALETLVEVTPESCMQYGDAQLQLAIGGGSGNYDIIWSNGADTQILNDINSGVYTAFITDENNCTHVVSVDVPLTSDLRGGFDTDAEIFELKNGAAVVQFRNTSQHALSHEWLFDDGTITSYETNPTHLFNNPGEYTVTQLSRSAGCEMRTEKTLRILELNETTTGLASHISGAITDDGIQLIFLFDEPKNLMINAYNVLGQQLIEPLMGTYLNETIYMSERRYASNAIIEITDMKSGERAVIRLGQ